MLFQQFLFGRHLNEDEKILYVGHKHWISIIGPLFGVSFFGILFPWGFYFLLSAPMLLWFAIATTLLVYLRIFYMLVDWYFDAIIVTTESLMFVAWHGIFHQESTRIAYGSVESIGIETIGVNSTVFGYGTVIIEREAADAISMTKIKNPKRLELEILRGKEHYEERNLSERSDALQDILSHLVAEHVRKHGWRKK